MAAAVLFGVAEIVGLVVFVGLALGSLAGLRFGLTCVGLRTAFYVLGGVLVCLAAIRSFAVYGTDSARAGRRQRIERVGRAVDIATAGYLVVGLMPIGVALAQRC